MKTICFYFQVHQPNRLKKYRFFEIGNDHQYYDDFLNKKILKKIAQKCYLPMNKILLKLNKEYGTQFKISFSISGTTLDQFKTHAPEVLNSFKQLAETGNVEFLAETYAHSLTSLKSKNELKNQIKLHEKTLKKYLGVTPKTFRNTELVYSDEIGQTISELGYNTILTEGAKHILGWKSPNLLYYNAINPKQKILLRNFKLSDDIAFRFSNQTWKEWPLTAEKYIKWLKQLPENEEIINLFMDYETFGEHQWENTGIFKFIENLIPKIITDPNLNLLTPTEITKKYQPVAPLNIPNPISWADEERDLSAWLGNEMQDEAFDTLYKLENIIKKINNPEINKDWLNLQTSDHFYYMCTKIYADGDVHTYFNPHADPYKAFINYMNVLSDFIIRIEKKQKNTLNDNEPKTKKEANELIKKYKLEIKKLTEKFNENNENKKNKPPKTKNNTQQKNKKRK